jgi:hypothetical protein
MSTLSLILAATIALVPATAVQSPVISQPSNHKILDALKSAPVNKIVELQKKGAILITQKYGGADPHGDDPHGDDPHDETHDGDLPANAERGTGKAPRDVYGGTVPNGQKPY